MTLIFMTLYIYLKLKLPLPLPPPPSKKERNKIDHNTSAGQYNIKIMRYIWKKYRIPDNDLIISIYRGDTI